MKTFKDYDYVIVVDGDSGAPVSWDGEQLCFCSDQYWEDEAFPVRILKKTTARRYIKQSIKYRKSHRWADFNYKMLPVVK